MDKLRSYQAANSLTRQENSVLEWAVLTRLLFGPLPGQDVLAEALRELEKFREEERRIRSLPPVHVSIIDEKDWLAEWKEQRRLLPALEVKLDTSQANNFGGRYGRFNRELGFAGSVCGLLAAQPTERHWPAIDGIEIQRIDPNLRWKGSQLYLDESSGAIELGMQVYTPTTQINAIIDLTSRTFDHLARMVEECPPEKYGANFVWLAIGWECSEFDLPQRHKVERDEQIKNPFELKLDGRRLYFELAASYNCSDNSAKPRIERLARWMAVEKTESS